MAFNVFFPEVQLFILFSKITKLKEKNSGLQ